MRYTLLLIATLICSASGFAQITITTSDMPAVGDTLRYSIASPVGSTISPADSGANVTWHYSLTSTSQSVDTYALAVTVNPLFALAGLTAYGYKVSATSPIPVPGVTVQNVYTFFQNSSSTFEAKAYAATISGLPAAFNYSTPDTWYFFPLTYGNSDSSNFALNINVPTIGTIKQTGNRVTRVDGWGTITTPYYTTPVSCIRVRSVISQVDSVTFAGTTLGLPQNTVEYKWLVNGQHYPALWVVSTVTGTGTETVSSVRYRDSYRVDSTGTTSVPSVSKNITYIKAYPNPAVNSFTLAIPETWTGCDVQLFDMSSRLVADYGSKTQVDIAALPAGN